jgi:hypothetical protein
MNIYTLKTPKTCPFIGIFCIFMQKIHKCDRLLGVCRASRIKPQKIAFRAIFYPANSGKQPDNRDFCVTGGAKIHKCDRLLEYSKKRD